MEQYLIVSCDGNVFRIADVLPERPISRFGSAVRRIFNIPTPVAFHLEKANLNFAQAKAALIQNIRENKDFFEEKEETQLLINRVEACVSAQSLINIF